MKFVIIGAGQTGRGFIAPFISNAGHEITFIDKDENLISELQKEKQYTVNYFEEGVNPLQISGFNAINWEDAEVDNYLQEADVIITSVFAGNIESLVPKLKEPLSEKSSKAVIICIENGVNVKKPLIDAQVNANISEGVIYCTSIADKNSLTVTSEFGLELPIDGSIEGVDFDIEGMVRVFDFPKVIQRKIYTYNFMSAIIAYLGSYEGSSNYATAANSETIEYTIEKIRPTLNQFISEKYGFDLKQQEQFTQKAIDKFQNYNIPDSIVRNTQQAKRKLGKNERLMVPLGLAQEYGLETRYIDLIISAAMFYAIKYEEEKTENIMEFVRESVNSPKDMMIIKSIFSKMIENKPLVSILRDLETGEI